MEHHSSMPDTYYMSNRFFTAFFFLSKYEYIVVSTNYIESILKEMENLMILWSVFNLFLLS